MASSARSQKHSYHHGNLREALLRAGVDLLEKHGLEGISLRKVAAAAGVSHAAPAHHFPSLKSLLTALAAIGFERFDIAMRAERDRAPNSPDEQLQAAGMGYAKFATRNPGLFRLMFSATRIDVSDPVLKEHANAAFAQLAAISAPIASNLGLDEKAAAAVQKLVWCVAHGYAHLYIEGQVQRFETAGKPGTETPDPPDLAGFLFPRGRAAGTGPRKM